MEVEQGSEESGKTDIHAELFQLTLDEAKKPQDPEKLKEANKRTVRFLCEKLYNSEFFKVYLLSQSNSDSAEAMFCYPDFNCSSQTNFAAIILVLWSFLCVFCVTEFLSVPYDFSSG